MGQLRTANKRHKRAIAIAVRKAHAAPAKDLPPIAAPVEADA